LVSFKAAAHSFFHWNRNLNTLQSESDIIIIDP